MPKLYMLIGVPASGKSTWVEKYKGDALVISSDDLIEAYAAEQGKTYNEVFKEQIKIATKIMLEHAEAAFAADQDVIWDQTNLTAKGRAAKLNIVPEHYEKVAMVFSVPGREEWLRRLDSRPGKTIPRNILEGMLSTQQMPTEEEGFHDIVVVS